MICLISERLFLRELNVLDWSVIKFLRSDPEVNRFVKRNKVNNRSEALEFIHKIRRGVEEGSFYYWVITERGDPDRMIGSICLWNFDEMKENAELGFDLDPKVQRKGYMTEAMEAVLNFAFKELQLDSLSAYTHHKNNKSQGLLNKFDFIYMPKIKDHLNAENIVFKLENTHRK